MKKEQFAEILGHEKNIKRLKKVLQKENLPHAWIFYGESGIGKHLIAQLFSRYLLSKKEEFLKKDLSIHPDFLELISTREKPSIKIKDVKNALEKLARKPLIATHKILIIDDVKDLTLEGANTLLKNLEEPPGREIYLLITKSLDSLLDTIKSRCVKLYFAPLKNEELRAFFKAQNINLTEKILQHATGSIEKAQQLLEEDHEALEKKAEELLMTLKEQDTLFIFNLGENISKMEKPKLLDFLSILRRLTHDILLIYQGKTTHILQKDIQKTKTRLTHLPKKNIFHIEKLINDTQNILLNTNSNTRLQIEIFFLKLQQLLK